MARPDLMITTWRRERLWKSIRDALRKEGPEADDLEKRLRTVMLTQESTAAHPK